MLRRVFFLIFIGAVAGAAVTLATPQSRTVIEGSSAKAAAVEAFQQLSLFSDVFERVRSDYVEKPDDAKLIEAAIKGMLAELDPHSIYLDARSFRDAELDTLGKFDGLGLEITSENGLIKVISAIDETPAAQAGIVGSDIITHIDDEPVDGLNVNQVADKLRGPASTKVKLTIRRRDHDKPIEMVITRAVVRVISVRWHLEDEDVGYVRISQFNEQTTSGLKKAINDFKAKKGDKLKGFIVDLRNNPGGLVDQAISVANAFLKQGEILSNSWPQCGWYATFHCPSGQRHKRWKAGDNVDQWRFGLGLRNRRRGLARSQACNDRWHAILRQRLGADADPAWSRKWSALADHCALFHALRPLNSSERNFAGHRNSAGCS